MATLIGHPELGSELELAFVQLRRMRPAENLTTPTEQEYSVAFKQRIGRIREVRIVLRGTRASILERLRVAVLHFLGGEVAAKFVSSNDSLTSEDMIVDALSEFEESLPITAKEMVAICARPGTLEELRDDLEISYGEFNLALVALGEPYKPFRNVEGHEQTFAYFKRSHADSILGALRERFVAHFDSDASLNAYVTLRSLDELVPEPDWLDRVSLPSDLMMFEHVELWLKKVGASPMGDCPTTLPPVEEVRSSNRKTIDDFYDRSANVVLAWCGKHSTDPPEVWANAENGVRGLADALEASGRLDFRLLTSDRLISILQTEQLWPPTMPPTTSLDALEITESQVVTQASSVERERDRKRDERRSIALDGESHIADPDRYGSLAAIVRKGVTEGFLDTPARTSRLQSAPTRTVSGGGFGGGGSGSSVRATTVQRNAIGFVGEVLAYDWLRKQYPEDVTPDAWRSTYRRHSFGGDVGDDRLGYDFEVVLKSRTRLFEVKATSTDKLEIELGESEVKCARKYARSKTHIYRVLFIRNALDRDTRSLHVLPNPFSDEGQEAFRFVGSGLKYQFRLASDAQE